MPRFQQSIEVNVPAYAAYSQLTQFEEYPRFMQDVDAVRRTDDTHLHWSTDMSGRQMEWDSEITEQRADSCIAWRNVSGPQNAGKVELQPVGQQKVRVTLTMECEPDQMPAGQGRVNAGSAVAQRLEQDLARLKQLLEHRVAEDDAVGAQAGRSTQSDYALSGSPQDQAGQPQFSVAEEVSFDQHSDQARRVGQMSQDSGAAGMAGEQPSEALTRSLQEESADEKHLADVKQSLERAVPPSEESAPPSGGGKV